MELLALVPEVGNTVYSIIVSFVDPMRLTLFRRGARSAPNVVALGIAPQALMTTPGIDAIYLSFTAAEQWGSKPLGPGEVGLLHTSADERVRGMAPFILYGIDLNVGDPDTAEFVVPLVARGIEDQLKVSQAPIKTIGIPDDLWMLNKDAEELGRLFARAFCSAEG